MTPTEAASALIASFRAIGGAPIPAQAHAVWVQTRVNRQTGEAMSALMVAVNPAFADSFSVPDVFQGYAIEKHAWPNDPRQVLGVSA